MQATRTDTRLLEAEGIVQQVDDTGRGLKVAVNGELVAFQVPSGCKVCLGEQLVGLRCLQPLDHVRIAYALTPGAKVAHFIQASWFPLPRAAG